MTNDGTRLFSGDEIEGGRIVLLPTGKAFAYPSPWVDISPLRKGRRKVTLPDFLLVIVHAMELSMAAQDAAERAVSPAKSVKEASCHLAIARSSEGLAADARARSVTLYGGPIEAALSLQNFQMWMEEMLMAHASPEVQQGVKVALHVAKEATRSDSARRLLLAIEALATDENRPPFRAELRATLGLDSKEKDRELRRMLKRLGFDWLPTGKGGRPKKA